MKLSTSFKLDKPNHNSRVYTTECMKKAMDEKIATGIPVFLASLDNQDLETLDLQVGVVTSYTIDNSQMTVEATIVDKAISAMIEAGVDAHADPRGYGNVTNSIVEDFTLIGFDLTTPEHEFLKH